MAVQDRIERYSRIRAWLNYPFAQAPRPHQILNQMCVEEQWLNLRLTNEAESWNLLTKSLPTVSGTSEYTITQPITSSPDQLAGKLYFVTRTTSDADYPYVPIPFEDYSERSYGRLPTGMANVLEAVEKISVYRTGIQDQALKVVIQPTPQEVLTYTLYFFTGQIDRTDALMAKPGPVSEVSDLLDLKASLALLPYAKWSDRREDNEAEARKLAAGLKFQYDELTPVVDEYINSINGPTDFDLGFAI